VNNRILPRDKAYLLLREALLEYSALKQSVDLEIFAHEMSIDENGADSADPALLDEFNKIFAETVTLRECLLLAADYVAAELQHLRHIDAAKEVVEDLRAGAGRPEQMAHILKRVFCPGAARAEGGRVME
jgi:hypothetical protein